MYLEAMNSAASGAPDDRERTTPKVDPRAWSGQLEIVEDPYLSKRDRKIETGFRGRIVQSVRDKEPDPGH